MIKLGKKLLGRMFPRIKYERQFIRNWSRVQPEIAFLSELCRSESIALDIGANRGGYVWHLKPLVRLVVAFEPLPPMLAILRRIYSRSIQTEGVVLSDREGEIQLRYPAGDFERATVATSNDLADQREVRTLNVPAKTLDSYGFQNVSFVKIDVEGHEEAVLRGGMETLKRETPNLIIEIEERHCPGSIQRVSDLLKEFGYSGYYVEGNSVLELANFIPSRDQPPPVLSESGSIAGKYINNFLFFPNRTAEMTERAITLLLQKNVSETYH
jgi:FkbM family methyltransferase